ncbi:pyridoxal phosphate-dependent aminotransferase [Leptothrix discophora]|uniref:Pyridoxal phosphate-dependent aminotransferase n=1 Tax=Leptothrix discophora TaxID=89 RepID=A0ABT9G2N4_LEPDI|nr:pyridoxal phosphate-dependent aminotransferase [Leptothrix discophora]MDP4300527.1 pyridoxal phosphate-dependent aminotransferase [Leptothrix discophora]
MTLALPAALAQPASRLPAVGTTIFTVMSALASETGAVNLGQGFPDFDGDPALMQAVKDALDAGHNQYPPMAGLPALREAVAAKIATLYGTAYDPGSEITITAGATQAILTAVLALTQPGDEVIVLEPAYDSYGPSIEMAGARTVRVPLTPGTFRPDFERIAAAITPRTRALIVNTPHNPSGTVWTEAEMAQLAALLRDTPIVLIADEVYEHMAYDGVAHQSVARHPELAARSVLISSFGKTYHVTGWKVAYAAAPAALMAEFRKVHQFNVFTVNTPMQHALARYMADPRPYLDLAGFYQRKRDRFRAGLAGTALRLLPCEGTYFQSVDYSGLPGPIAALDENAFCRWLTTEVGVAAIPLSAFYQDGFNQQIARLCFAKRDETLDRALARLAERLT